METLLGSTATFESRGSEVRELVQEGDTNLAVRRLLDLAKDFAQSRELRNEAIAASAKHNALRSDIRRYGLSPEVKRDQDMLVTHLLELVDLIEEDAYRQPALPQASPNDVVSVPGHAVPGIENRDVPDNRDPDNGLLNSSSFEMAKRAFQQRERDEIRKTELQLPVCRCEHLSKTYGKGSVPFSLRDVSLALTTGRVTGLVGANGHGKTTLLRILAGDLKPTGGTLQYPLIAIGEANNWLRIKGQIAYVPQDNLSWGKATLETSLRFTAAAYGRTKVHNDDEVEFILYRLGLERYRYAKWNEISGGYRLRGAIANALMSRPKLMILDEPLANLDIDTQLRFLEDLRDLARAREGGFATLITSQHLNEIEMIADEILLLKEGAPEFYGPKSEIGRYSTVNTFELGSSLSCAELTRLFAGHRELEIIQVGSYFVLKVGHTISGGEVLGRLISAEAQVYYFRDLSNSIRSIMMKRDR